MPSDENQESQRYRTLFFRLSLGGLILVAVLIRLYVFSVSTAYIPVTSDEAITVLQAKTILRGHVPLLMMSQPYMFPLEAYWMVPLVNLAPRTPGGMRSLMLIEGFLSCLGLWLILFRVGKWKEIWPGLLLVLFPSAYYLMTHYGYSMPHHISAHILWWLAILLTWAVPRKLSLAKWVLTFLAAFVCGLALTNSLLSLAFVFPLVLMLGLRLKGPRFWGLSLVAIGSFFVGFFPHLLARWVFPGAHQAIAGTRDIPTAFSMLWKPTLSFTFPRAMGLAPCLFPDSEECLAAGSSLSDIFALLYIVILLLATARVAYEIIRPILRKQWPDFSVYAVFVMASWLGLLFFVVSTRADAHSYRYLAPVTLAFPVVLCCVYQLLPKWGRGIIGFLVVILIGYHLGSTRQVLAHWRQPGFARDVVSVPDLQPAIDYLQKNHIRHAVASHWAAYRIGFMTDEEIICSQPLNERFPGWPLPYKAQVDQATNIAYVLTSQIRFLKPAIFERHMRTMQVTSTRQPVGDFIVYHDFREMLPNGPEQQVPKSQMRITSSHGDESCPALLDDDRQTKWFSGDLQNTNMWIQAEFEPARWINRMTLYYGRFAHDIVPVASVEAHTDAGWQPVEDQWQGILDKFAFENNHPVYGIDVQTLRFEPVHADAIRIKIHKPNTDFCWTITELALFFDPEPH